MESAIHDRKSVIRNVEFASPTTARPISPGDDPEQSVVGRTRHADEVHRNHQEARDMYNGLRRRGGPIRPADARARQVAVDAHEGSYRDFLRRTGVSPSSPPAGAGPG